MVVVEKKINCSPSSTLVRLLEGHLTCKKTSSVNCQELRFGDKGQANV